MVRFERHRAWPFMLGGALAAGAACTGSDPVFTGSTADAGARPEEAGTNASTVAGKVVGQLGEPLAGVQVIVDGKTVTSARDGTFSVEGVAIPYDATVLVENAVTGDAATVFVGLTRLDPTLHPTLIGTEYVYSKVTGSLAVTPAPDQPVQMLLTTKIGTSAGIRSAATPVDGGGATFTASTVTPIGVADSALYDFNLLALQVTPETGLPQQLLAYSKKSVGSHPAGLSSDVGLTPLPALGTLPITSKVASVAIAAPADYTLDRADLEYRFEQETPYRFSLLTGPIPNPLTLAVGEYQGLVTSLSVEAMSQAGEYVTVTTQPVAGSSTLALPAIDAKIVTPLGAATDFGTGSTVTWSKPSFADKVVYEVFLVPSTTDTHQTLRISVITGGTSCVIPDVKAIGGSALPSNTVYELGVKAYAPYATVDDALGEQAFDRATTTTTSGIRITTK